MSKKQKISEEDFSAWKDNPITLAVLDYLLSRRDLAHQIWTGTLHDVQATKDQVEALRIELRAKVEFIEDFIELKLGDIQDDDTGAIIPIDSAKRSGKSTVAH